MKRLTVLMAIFMSVIFIIPNIAEARWLNRMEKRLNLTAQQTQQIKKLMYNSKRYKITLRAKLQLARLDVRQLLEQHRPNIANVSKAIDKVGAIQLALHKHRILNMLKIKALLSPEQAKKLDQWQHHRKHIQMMRRRAWKRGRRAHRRGWRGRRAHRRGWRGRRARRRMGRRARRRMGRRAWGNPPNKVNPPTPSTKKETLKPATK